MKSLIYADKVTKLGSYLDTISTSAGIVDAGKAVLTDATGKIHSSLLPPAVVTPPMISSTTGAADAGKLILTDVTGKLNNTFIQIPSVAITGGPIDADKYIKTNGVGLLDASFFPSLPDVVIMYQIGTDSDHFHTVTLTKPQLDILISGTGPVVSTTNTVNSHTHDVTFNVGPTTDAHDHGFIEVINIGNNIVDMHIATPVHVPERCIFTGAVATSYDWQTNQLQVQIGGLAEILEDSVSLGSLHTGLNFLPPLTATSNGSNVDVGIFFATGINTILFQDLAGDIVGSNNFTWDDVGKNLNVSGLPTTTISILGQPVIKWRESDTAPTSSTATGLQGDFFCNATFAYVCIATDTWVRIPVTASF